MALDAIETRTPINSPSYKEKKKGEQSQTALDALETALMSPPALELIDVTDNKGIAKEVLTQRLGPWKRPVAYL